MFRVEPTDSGKSNRLAIVSLLALSAAALAVTVWVMVDFLHEQEIVHALVSQLPPEAALSAEALEGELRWQFRLSILVVLNLVVTAFAMVLLSRANLSTKESLRDLKAQASDILSSMDLAVITTDLDGTVTSINRRGIELFGLDGDDGDLVGRPLSELSEVIALEEFRQITRLSNQTELVRDYSQTINGSMRVLRGFCQPLRNHELVDVGNILQLRDVTERVLMSDRLRRMERYMGLGSLAVGLHHEIKNPLAALSLHVQLLEEEIAGVIASDEIHEMLNVIKTEVARVGGVLESFRDFASLGHLSLAKVDVVKLVKRQVRLIGPQADQQNVEVSVDVSTRPIPILNGDLTRLEQVLLNLLVNALEAMPKGGTLTIRVLIIETGDTEVVRIEVIDSGPGIPENIRDRIFDPYFTTKCNGTGMGLALSDKIMRQHGGGLDFRSTKGGTDFGMTLPIERDRESDAGETL